MTRTILDLAKPKTTVFDLSTVLNPRVNDDLVKISFHIQYDNKPFNMTGYKMYFISADENMGYINVDGMVDKVEYGDNVGNGDVTFKFPPNVFKKAGTFDSTKTMFVVENINSNYIQSTINISLTVLENGIAKFNADVDQIGYDSKLEEIHNKYKDKAQNLIDELINQVQAVNNFSDVKETAEQAKQVANDSVAKVNAVNNEVITARSRFSNLNDRLNNQDIKINAAETTINANDNYNRLTEKDLSQDKMISNKADKVEIESRLNNQDEKISNKADKNEIERKLSQISLVPEAFDNVETLKSKYPTGKTGIFITVDTGHKWIYSNQAWVDAGVYQSESISDNSVNNEMIKSVNFNKVRDNLVERSKVQVWNKASEVTLGDDYFTLTAKGGDAGAIVPFDVPVTKSPVYLSYEFKVLDGTGLTRNFDVYSLRPDGNVDHTLQSVPLTTTGYSKVEIPVDYTKQTNEILVSIHGTGKVQVSVSINRSGEVRSLEQLSTDVGALSKINDDEYTNIFAGSLAPFQNAKISKVPTGYQIELDGTNSGAATDWFATDKKQVLVHVTGTKGFKTINIVLAHMDAAGSIHYTTLASSQDGRYDIAVKFKTEDYNAAKYRLIVQSSDENAGGEATINKLEIIPLDELQLNTNYDRNLREMIKKMLIAEGEMNQISAIYDADYTNLWNGVLTKFGSPQIDKIGPEYIITVTKPNDGGISPQYQSSSAKTKIHVEGSFTTRSVDIQVAYQTPNGQKYMKLGHVEGGTINNDFYFDAVNLAVYQQASSFRTLIQCNDDNPKGVINITSLGEYELSSFQENPIYDRSMQKMMMNIMAKLDQVSGAVDAIKADNGLYLTNTQGQKVQLVLNDDGTVGTKSLSLNKVLFLGNSLLLGLDTNNESGGPFGMCASDSKHDYAYYVEQAILAKNSKATFTKLHDAPFEQAETDEAAQSYINDNNDKFKNQNLVLIQIGDNVGTDIRIKTFKNNLKSLVERVKADSPNVRILLIGIWYGNNGLSDFIKQVAQDTGCEFVSIYGLNTWDNRAKVGDTITFNNGSTMAVPAKYASHPGDKGHKAIADAILAQLAL